MVVAERTRDLESTLDTFSRLVRLDEHDRKRVLKESGRRRSFVPVTVRENLTWEQMAVIQVNAPDLPGIRIDEGLTRDYPYSDLASHILGYVAAVSEEEIVGDDPLLQLPNFRIGKAGIEKVYDLPLRGKAGTSQVEVNAVGRIIRELRSEEGEPGHAVNLTIDMRLQELASRRLGDESAACVVMDVHTGEVLAMASMPAYDPNAFARGLTTAEWRTLSGNPRAPAAQQGPGRSVRAGLHVQDGGRPGRPGKRHHRAGADLLLPRSHDARQPSFPLLEALGPWRHDHDLGHRAIV